MLGRVRIQVYGGAGYGYVPRQNGLHFERRND